MTWAYKILVSSLYERLNINLESIEICNCKQYEICNRKQYKVLLKKDNFISAEKLADYYYIVKYIVNGNIVDDLEWKTPRMSAVHIAAAITACARIYIYPYISRPDCYYTDTDSIVLGSPLLED